MLGVIETEGLPDDAGLSLESMFGESNYFVLPEEEVSPGDSWTLDAPMSFPAGPAAMSVEVELTHTFVSLEGNLVTLSFEGPIDMSLAVEEMGMSSTGTMSGTMVVDLAEGRYQSQTTQTSLDMSTGGMTMKMSSTTTLELLPDP